MNDPVPAKVNKSVFLSKTFYFGLLTAVAPLFPSVQVWVSENVATVGMLWGALSVILRMVTKDKVVLKD
jgi:hypothetical protein